MDVRLNEKKTAPGKWQNFEEHLMKHNWGHSTILEHQWHSYNQQTEMPGKRY